MALTSAGAQELSWNLTLDKISSGVVSIQVDSTRAFDTERNQSSQATGFIVDAEQGLILTNRHVVTPGPVVAQAVFLNQELDKYANEVLLPEMKKVFSSSSIEKKVIGEIIGFDRKDKSDACELISSLTGDNSRQVVSFGTEAGLFQEIGISTVVCGPGSIEQAHKIDEFIILDELKKCLKLLDGIKEKSSLN